MKKILIFILALTFAGSTVFAMESDTSIPESLQHRKHKHKHLKHQKHHHLKKHSHKHHHPRLPPLPPRLPRP